MKCYWVIIHLNFHGKVVEKLISMQLSLFCEAKKKLLKKRMGANVIHDSRIITYRVIGY